MAIPLVQPVDEITHGLEGIKLDGHVKASEKVEVQNSPGLPSAEVTNVQPLSSLSQEWAEHPRDQAAIIGYPILGDQHSEFPGTIKSTEALNQPYFDISVYTGFAAPIHEYPPNSAEGTIYHNPVVEYNPVYNQNFYCSAPCTVGQYNYGYGQTYVYPQYQVPPVEQYTVATPVTHDDGVMMPEGSYMPYGYQPMLHGQFIPMAVTGPSPSYNNITGFHPMPYSPVYIPHVLNAAAPAWVQKQPMNAKGLNEANIHVQLKSGFQQPSISPDGNANATKSTSEKGDSVVHATDVKKHGRKQFGPGPVYGVPVPVKGAWVRAGHLQCVNTAQPLKSFGGKNKGPGVHSLNSGEFNSANFSTEFEDAKHFIIKSFSEDNVYRSIQHGVWASTPHGNKKLDEAYEDAQRRAAGKAKGFPVFLYFSVNGSGKFCGVAEMMGPVDFNNTMDFWERNRWCGSFPVKWHFVKDVPHCQLRRIILQNNENKPVTSSRDTQEVNFTQGLQMLNIFKGYITTASILDNFPSLTGPPKDVPDEKVEQGTLETGGDSRVAQEPSVNAVLESNNTSKACNGETKAREDSLQGKLNKGKSETLVQVSTGDKENTRVPELV